MTTAQIRNRTKTVTRRLGWKTLKPGTLLQPVVKAQGLMKGEKVEKIGGPIKVVSVRREPLNRMGYAEVQREGFRGMRLTDFIEMFIRSHKCGVFTEVTRIEFEFVDEVTH